MGFVLSDLGVRGISHSARLYSQGQRKEYQGVVKAKEILAFLRRAKEGTASFRAF